MMCKPFTYNRINMLEIVNEVTNLLLLYHVILFSGMIDNTEERYLYGWSFIVITSLNLCMHLLLLLYEGYWNIRKQCIRRKLAAMKVLPVLSVIVEEDSFESNFSIKKKAEMK